MTDEQTFPTPEEADTPAVPQGDAEQEFTEAPKDAEVEQPAEEKPNE